MGQKASFSNTDADYIDALNAALRADGDYVPGMAFMRAQPGSADQHLSAVAVADPERFGFAVYSRVSREVEFAHLPKGPPTTRKPAAHP
jgi:hypothetical protein